jgi:hypothetical protein
MGMEDRRRRRGEEGISTSTATGRTADGSFIPVLLIEHRAL